MIWRLVPDWIVSVVIVGACAVAWTVAGWTKGLGDLRVTRRRR